MTQQRLPQQEMAMGQVPQAIQVEIPRFRQLGTKIPCFQFL